MKNKHIQLLYEFYFFYFKKTTLFGFNTHVKWKLSRISRQTFQFEKTFLKLSIEA